MDNVIGLRGLIPVDVMVRKYPDGRQVVLFPGVAGPMGIGSVQFHEDGRKSFHKVWEVVRDTKTVGELSENFVRILTEAGFQGHLVKTQTREHRESLQLQKRAYWKSVARDGDELVKG